MNIERPLTDKDSYAHESALHTELQVYTLNSKVLKLLFTRIVEISLMKKFTNQKLNL